MGYVPHHRLNMAGGGRERGKRKEEEAFCHFTCDRREARDGNRTMEKNAMLLKRPSKTSNSD